MKKLTRQYGVQMKARILTKIILIISVLMISGCSWVYKINIPQGNYLNDKDIALIEAGMTKDQITYLLGAPMLFDDYKSNQWFYVYYLKEGHKEAIQKNLVIHFDDKGKVIDYKKDDIAVK